MMRSARDRGSTAVEVDQFGGGVLILVQPGGLLRPLTVRVTGDAACQGQPHIDVEPDAVVPEAEVLRAQREDPVDDEHRIGRSTDRVALVVLAGQGVVGAQDHVTRSQRPGRRNSSSRAEPKS